MNRWDSLRDILSIQDRVNRLFEDGLETGKPAGDAGTGRWFPVVDIYETENDFVVEAEVPDVRQSDIDIRVQKNTLTISGERKLHMPEMEGYYRIERDYGRFVRSFFLPDSVEQEYIKASLRDGILKICLPKKQGYRQDILE